MRFQKIKTHIFNLLGALKSPVMLNVITVGIITVLIKVLGFFKETVIASTFGLSELLDTFYIAILIPGFISTVFLGAFKNVFIPNYVRESKTSNNIGAFQTNGFLITIGVAALFTIIAVLFTDTYIESFFIGHSISYYDLIKTQFYYVVPCIVLWGLSSLLTGLLNIHDEFKISSISGVFLPISVLFCLFFLKDSLEEKVLAIGTLVGTTLTFIFLLIISIKKRIIVLDKPNFKSDNTRLMLTQIPAKVSSGFLTGLIPVTDQYFAAQLAIGSIAALNYGLKLPSFLTGIIIISINNVILPYFSKLAIENKKKAFEKLFVILKKLFLISTIITIIVIFFSNSLIELLFERNSFTSENTAVVSKIQIIFLIYAPFTVSGMVIVNFLTSINKNNFMAVVSLIAVILNIILDIVFMKIYGIYGIAMCTTCIVIIRFLILLKYSIKENNRLIL